MPITAYLETGIDTVCYKYTYLHRWVVPASELEGEVHERPTVKQIKEKSWLWALSELESNLQNAII